MARSKRKRPAGDDIGVPLPPLAPVNDETQTSAQQVKRARQTTSDEDGVSRQVCLLLDEVLQRNISVQGNDIVHKIVPHLLPKVGTDGILALLNIIVKLDQPDGLHQSDETVGEHSGGGCAVPDMSFTLPNKPAQPELRKVSMGLTDNISPAIMTERLLDFMLCLNELRVVMKANGKPSLTGFTLEQKHQLCNIVLNDIMGARAISHLEKLVCEHDKCMQKEPNEELALRTNNLTNDHAKPDELREFFYYILAQLGMRQKPKSLTQKLHHMIYKYKVVKRFLALEELVKIPDGELRQYLESIGNGPAHGKGWDVCLVQYLNEELGYDPKSNKLNNLMQHGRVMEGLIDEFGLAIICLFTSRDINILYGIGVQKLREAWPELRKRFSELAIVCLLLHKNVLEPIMNHQPIQMAKIEIDIENSSLLSMIREAVEKAGGYTVVQMPEMEMSDGNNEANNHRDKVMGDG